MAHPFSSSLSPLDKARRAYRQMLVSSGMSAANFRAACERTQAFAQLRDHEDYWRYQCAAVDVVSEIHGVDHDIYGNPCAPIIVGRPRCERCGGAGTISAYRHIAGGICFECDGTGFPS